MPDENRHESADLADYEVNDSADTLDGSPGDDPLDRGVIPPERWSSAMRFGSTASEQQSGESLDQLLAEEEPDITAETDERPGDADDEDDEDAPDADDDGPDPRAGRLVAGEEDADPDLDPDLLAQDVGVDGGAATAEEAAVHVVYDDDHPPR
jgi:uncharacterized protein DUF5709